MFHYISSEATEQICDSCKCVEVVYATNKDDSNYPLPQRWALVKLAAYKDRPETIKLWCEACHFAFMFADHWDEGGNLIEPRALYTSQLLNYDGIHPTKT